jgi:hypothetical protein
MPLTPGCGINLNKPLPAWCRQAGRRKQKIKINKLLNLQKIVLINLFLVNIKLKEVLYGLDSGTCLIFR